MIRKSKVVGSATEDGGSGQRAGDVTGDRSKGWTAGYLSHDKQGRRNRYRLRPDTRLRHPLERDIEIERFLDLFVGRRGRAAESS